jgi:two-component system, sensor histidine kinase YesM
MTLKNEVSAYVANTLEQVNNNIDNTFVQLSNIAANIGLDESIQGILKKDSSRSLKEKIQDDEKAAEIIENATINFTNIEALHIFSYNGEVYSMKGASSSLVADYNFTRKKWFEKMKQLKKKSLILPTYIQTDITEEGNNRKVFGYIMEINDVQTNKNIGYLMVEMDISVFASLLQSISSNQTIIIDDNKTVIYHTQSEYISSQFQTNYVSELLERKAGHMISKLNAGEQMITFNTSANTGWTVLSVIPTNILFSKINSFKLAMVYTIILCILSSIVIAILMSNTVTEPISLLKSRMKMAESGDFDIQIDVKSKDEIGELSISFNNMIARIKKLIQRVYQTEILRKEAELSALQAQINPHFLYNTLQIMDIMAEEKGADEISGSCRALARIFRYSISKGQGFVSLKEEVLHVKNYVYIQQLRLGDLLKVKYNIDDQLYKYEIIKLVLQPLVENAILHGIENSGRSCVIKVSATVERQSLIIDVEDDGAGMEEDELKKVQHSLYQEAEDDPGSTKSGIALRNVNNRIKLYYSDQYGMSIQSIRNVGTKVTLVLPAKIFV